MTSKTVSVIVPVHNSEATIRECLQALRQQTSPPLEVVVVDDGSTDRTAEVSEDLALVIPNARGKGAGGARNTGAFASQGEIIAFIDSDCVPPTDWVENIVSAFSDETVGAVGGGYKAGADDSFWQTFCCEELIFRRRNRRESVETLVSNNLACRRSAFQEAGGFPEKYPVCEDMMLAYRISGRWKVRWLNDNGVQHHFKDSLRTFLRHQYFFGAESTRFFLENRKLLTADTHQGKTLYFSVGLACLSISSALISLICVFLRNHLFAQMLLGVALMSILLHFLLYAGLVAHLVTSACPNVIKAYGVSLLRDMACGISIGDGIMRYMTGKGGAGK